MTLTFSRMYIPRHFQPADAEPAALLAFMRRYSFATLVTAAPGAAPVATHLPFSAELAADGQLTLSAHLARANPQAQQLTHGPALVIFSEPHAYVSPRYYEQEQNVPTWNYIAIHAYGSVRLLPNEADQRRVLEALIEANEPEYLPQWQGLAPSYQQRMLRGIVAFELPVEEVQAKYKLSQNRTPLEQATIAEAFRRSPDPLARQLTAYMPGHQENPEAASP